MVRKVGSPERLWLWLEDQPQTVFDIRAALEKSLKIEHFLSPVDLVRRLVELQESAPQQLAKLGFILDVMVNNHKYIISPPQWHGGSKTFYYATNSGYECGIVFYEKIVLKHRELSKPPITPPSPAIFLTVMHQDIPHFGERWTRLKRMWSRENACDQANAKLEWVRKWDPDLQGLRRKLREWESDK